MKQPAKNDDVDFRQFAAISDRVRLDAVRLSSVEAGLTVPLEDALRGQMVVDVVASARGEARSEPPCIDVTVSFGVDAIRHDPTTKVFSLKASLVLSYSLDSLEGFADEQIQAFAQVNGVYNAWPYIRELAQSLTTRMGLPALVIPVYRVPRSSRKQQLQQKGAAHEVAEQKK